MIHDSEVLLVRLEALAKEWEGSAENPRRHDNERDAYERCAAALHAALAAAPSSSSEKGEATPHCTLPGCRCIEEAKDRSEAQAWWDSRPKCRCGRPTWHDVSGVVAGDAEVLRCVGPCCEVSDRCKCDSIEPLSWETGGKAP